MSARASDVEVRPATPGEVVEVVGILDAAMLDVGVGRVRSLVDGDDGGAVLVAVADGPAVGALVLGAPDPGAPASAGDREIEAIAVRPGRRGRGIGSALVRAASERTPGDLVAAFDAGVRPFYERLGFAIEPIEEDRFRGRWSGSLPEDGSGDTSLRSR
mgnify:CR=1 FL=1